MDQDEILKMMMIAFKFIRPEKFEDMMKEEMEKMSHFNILVTGKSGVGKTTLINKVFGEEVGKVGRGRPVTDQITWYKPENSPLRLCDTKGLELSDYTKIINDLEKELQDCRASGKVEDRIHVAWICISEPGSRVEEGEQALARLCEKYDVPYIIALTKAIGPEEFSEDVQELLPRAKAIVRILTEDWKKPKVERFGLDDLVSETFKIIPKIIEDAFISAQKVDFDKKRSRARAISISSTIAAGAGSAVPIPLAAPGSFLMINIGMLISIASVVGVPMDRATATAIAGAALSGLGLALSVRMALGEALKFIPGIGSVAGAIVEGAAAASATFAVGNAFIEFLIWFHGTNARMPNAEEIISGFKDYFEKNKNNFIVKNNELQNVIKDLH